MMRSTRLRAMLGAVALVVATLVSSQASTHAAAPATGFVRVDQAGYATGESKQAYLMTTAAIPGARFTVVDQSGRKVFRGQAGASLGSWNATYPAVYPLDLSGLERHGTFRVQVGGAVEATSPPFRIAPARSLFLPLVGDTLAFFRAQRDGADVDPTVLGRQPSHLDDASAMVYDTPQFAGPDTDVVTGPPTLVGGPVDVEGGWFDAGDFLKFTQTTSYATAVMLAAQRDLRRPDAALATEARRGVDWLGKMWDPTTRTLYAQVGIGTGDAAGTFNGDHDIWRLPQADDSDTNPADVLAGPHRPVFRANAPGAPISPNLAGRVAASFALAAQVDARSDRARARRELDAAAQVFAMAQTQGVGTLVSAFPHSYYPERTWRDDMELGAAELTLAAQALHDGRADGWMRAAGHWGSQYMATEAGGDTFNLYDTSALAHADLVRAMAQGDDEDAPKLEVTRGQLLADMRRQIAAGATRAAADPFHAGAVYQGFDADSHSFGLAAAVQLYRRASGDTRFDAFGTEQRNWVLGANAWGASMVVGVGTTFPQCMQHQVGNLAGSLDGSPPVVLGAVVNGPNSPRLFDGGLGDLQAGMRQCPPTPGDPYAQLNGHGSRFVDDVRAWQTVEPALDMTVTALYAFALASRV